MEVMKPEPSRPNAPPEEFHRLQWNQRFPFMVLITGTGFFLGNCIHVCFTVNLHAVLYIICPFASLLCNSSGDTKQKK